MVWYLKKEPSEDLILIIDSVLTFAAPAVFFQLLLTALLDHPVHCRFFSLNPPACDQMILVSDQMSCCCFHSDSRYRQGWTVHQTMEDSVYSFFTTFEMIHGWMDGWITIQSVRLDATLIKIHRKRKQQSCTNYIPIPRMRRLPSFPNSRRPIPGKHSLQPILASC